MTVDADIAIVGAGCAGLSLAMRLAPTGQSIAIFDPRTAFARDRTWCFWQTRTHEHSVLVSQRWERWRVTAGDASTERQSDTYSYQMIESDRFYDRALEFLRRHDNVTLALGTAVTDVQSDGDGVVVRTAGGDHRVRAAADSRPEHVKNTAKQAENEPFLLQHFLGLTVRTSRPIFEPGTAILMDFQADDEGRIHFMYVLPTDRHTALVEDTYFGGDVLPDETYEAAIAAWLDARGAGPYDVTHRERGALPMTTAEMTTAPAPHIHRIGLAGGAARPATGYAFLAIQRQTRAVARALLPIHLATKDGAPAEPAAFRSPNVTRLDRIFLSRLTHAPEAAPHLFFQLFSRTDPDSLVRFLSEDATPRDALAVMASLPTGALTAEALRTYASRAKLRKPKTGKPKSRP